MSRILIIDNDDGLVRAIQTRLESLGHVCATANSGTQGIAIFQEQSPDLVVTDLNMPGDGIALATSIRRESNVPIIVMTGFEDAYDERLKGIDNLTVLQKPFDTSHLVDLVDVELSMVAPSSPPGN